MVSCMSIWGEFFSTKFIKGHNSNCDLKISLCSKFHSYKGDLNAIQQYRSEESFIQLLYGIGFQIYIFFSFYHGENSWVIKLLRDVLQIVVSKCHYAGLAAVLYFLFLFIFYHCFKSKVFVVDTFEIYNRNL